MPSDDRLMWYSIGIWSTIWQQLQYILPAVIPIKCTIMITAPQIMSVSSANPANVCISTELHLRNPKTRH